MRGLTVGVDTAVACNLVAPPLPIHGAAAVSSCVPAIQAIGALGPLSCRVHAGGGGVGQTRGCFVTRLLAPAALLALALAVGGGDLCRSSPRKPCARPSHDARRRPSPLDERDRFDTKRGARAAVGLDHMRRVPDGRDHMSRGRGVNFVFLLQFTLPAQQLHDVVPRSRRFARRPRSLQAPKAAHKKVLLDGCGSPRLLHLRIVVRRSCHVVTWGRSQGVGAETVVVHVPAVHQGNSGRGGGRREPR